MKAILLSSLILFGSVSAHAIEVTDATVEIPVIGPTIGITSAPFVFTYFTGAMTTFGDMKEVALAAKADAQDFLAGEEATNTLVKVVDILRTNMPELNQASNEEIVKMIATLE